MFCQLPIGLFYKPTISQNYPILIHNQKKYVVKRKRILVNTDRDQKTIIDKQLTQCLNTK